MGEWAPTLITSTLMASLSVINYLLYDRWRTKNYQYVYLLSGAAAACFLMIYLLAIALDSTLLRGIFSTASLLTFILLQATFFNFFNPGQFKHLKLHAGLAVACLPIGIILILNTTIGTIFLLILMVSFICLSYVQHIPKLPKQLLFKIVHVSFASGFLIQAMSGFELGGALLVGGMIIAASYLVTLLLFYQRIIDMVEAVSYSAVTDGLTGLYNKHYFIGKLKDFILQDRVYALIFVDIDHFKQLNDTQGHQAGDEILKLVAKIFKDTCKEHALVARYGGEEMVAVVVDNIDPGDLSELFRERVEEQSPSITPVTVSVGYSLYKEGLSAEQIIKQADDAMYKAKDRGRNRVVSYQVFD
ncbi:GGDEF domain-containing protein [Paenibacillus agilis]|uniref:GGDEF domain-containing protein n=1 Tax=Paenibacillus agilis TaxID=3020863 RepID=A0A559ID38_9BACL|nr:GGDEF domain-containing protein [Paenibacillus agilis]TVX85579.1 GGDEF domain-containing protein [Paenibacillus agilis]